MPLADTPPLGALKVEEENSTSSHFNFEFQMSKKKIWGGEERVKKIV